MRNIFLFLIILLYGCATSVTMTGTAKPPTDPKNVKVLFYEKPNCPFEELGFISTPLMWNQTVAIENAREEAAKIGADFISIQKVFKNAYNDAQVSALAYSCSSVDRNIESMDVN